MDTFISLLVVCIILLVPLIPAAVLYKVLTPKNVRRAREDNSAKGEVGVGDIRVAGFRLQFNVVGSSATYIVLVVAAFLMYDRISARQMVLHGMTEQSAWLVEVPVKLRDQNKLELPAKKGELQQVRVELEPALTQASANMLQFWVIPNNNRFPTARLYFPDSTTTEVLDLNDLEKVYPDYESRQLRGIAPVWLAFGTPYQAHPVPDALAPNTTGGSMAAIAADRSTEPASPENLAGGYAGSSPYVSSQASAPNTSAPANPPRQE